MIDRNDRVRELAFFGAPTVKRSANWFTADPSMIPIRSNASAAKANFPARDPDTLAFREPRPLRRR
jgi:hypothetical protein